MSAAYQNPPPFAQPSGSSATPGATPGFLQQQRPLQTQQYDRQYPPYVKLQGVADPGSTAGAPPTPQVHQGTTGNPGGNPSGYWPSYPAPQDGMSADASKQQPGYGFSPNAPLVPPSPLQQQPQPSGGSYYPSYPSAGYRHEPSAVAPGSGTLLGGGPRVAGPPAYPQPAQMHMFDHGSMGVPRPAGRATAAFPSASKPDEPLPDMHDFMDLCAGAEYVKSTVGRVPHSTSLKQKSHVPVGLLFRPLAPSDVEVPDVNFGSTGKVIRCVRCRTYVNGFSAWDTAGRRWTCNICGMSNECPPQYCCPLDETGRRADRAQRPELNCGTVEFIATGDYMVRPPQPPTYLFLIDVSAPSVASGLVATVCQGIKSALNTGRIPGEPRTQIGIMTFDSSVHFYKVDAQTAQPHMVVVPSLADVFVPLPDGVLVNLKECETQVRTLLDTLPSMWSSQKVAESCLGTALTAAHAALKLWGGKLLVFMSVLPTLGERKLSGHRDVAPVGRGAGSSGATDSKAAAAGKDATALLKPLHDEYQELATVMAQAQICVDIFACPPASPQQNPSPLGLPTLAPLCRYTAGDLRYYPGFNALSCGDKLREEVVHVLTRVTGWEAVMRIRVSQGWKITKWTGHFYFRNADLLVLPSCHEDQTFGITLEQQDNVVQEPYFYAQSALLYTSSTGERRIRVHTFCIPVTQSFGELMASVDQPTAVVFLTHNAVEQALKTNLADARTQLQTACLQLHSSLQQGATGNYAAKDAAPPPLILPYHVLGLLKSAAFRDGRDITPDLRIFHWLRLLSLPASEVVAYAVPRLYALHDLANTMYGSPDEHQQILLPPTVGLSAAHMSQNGAYLVEDSEAMMLWLGKALDPQWVRDVFGVDTADHIHPDHGDTALGASGANLGIRVAAIVQRIRSSHLPFMRLTVLRQGSPAEYKFFYALIEDKNHSCMISYDEFLAKLSVRTQPASTVAQPATGATVPSYAGYPNVAPSGRHHPGGPSVTGAERVPPHLASPYRAPGPGQGTGVGTGPLRPPLAAEAAGSSGQSYIASNPTAFLGQAGGPYGQPTTGMGGSFSAGSQPSGDEVWSSASRPPMPGAAQYSMPRGGPYSDPAAAGAAPLPSTGAAAGQYNPVSFATSNVMPPSGTPMGSSLSSGQPYSAATHAPLQPPRNY